MKQWKRTGGLFLIFTLLFAMTVPVFAAVGVRLNKKSASVYAGQSITLKVKGTAKKAKWSTTNKKVAAVQPSTGKVTAKKAGKAKITAKVGGKTLTCKLTVKKECLNKTSLTMSNDGTATLKLKGGSIKSVKSSAPSIVSVKKSGKITAKKVGTATVIVRSSTKKKYTCKVKVIKTSLSNTKPVVAKGDYIDVTLKGASLKSVKSGNVKIANVSNENGKIRIKGMKKGTVKIKAIDKWNKAYTCNAKVEEPAMSPGSQITLEVQETKQLRLTGNTQKVEWSSSDASIATVDSSGKVTGKSRGAAAVYANIGHISLKCEVVVRNVTYTVSFDTAGGSQIEPQGVESGSTVIRPENPTKEGFLFEGWYTDSACTAPYDFGNMVEANMTLYAQWKPLEVGIRFDAMSYEEQAIERQVRGEVSCNGPEGTIQGVSYTIKGANVEKTEEIQLDDESRFEKDVLLEKGLNQFTITVKTSDGAQTSESVEMIYDSGRVYDVDDPTIVKKSINQAARQAMEAPEAISENSVTGEEQETPANEEVSEISPDESANAEIQEGMQPDESMANASSNDIYYVSNLFNLYFKPEVSFADRKDFVEQQLQGEVAGYLSALDMMQVKFTGGSLPVLEGYFGSTDVNAVQAEELESYVNALADQYALILDSVELELMYDVPQQSIMSATRMETNDGWGGRDSNRWWHDRLSAGEAWRYSEYHNLNFLTDITLGIVDAGFDDGHEDLNRISVLSDEKSPDNHGTHVAGIMAAKVNNGRGIAGIMYNNASLRVYDAQKSDSDSMSDSQIMKGLVDTVEAGAKVVNFSLGMSASFSGEPGGWYEKWILNSEGKQASKAMGKLLGRGFDFIVVQAAGNGNDEGIGTDFTRNGTFCSVNEGNCYSDWVRDVAKEDIMNRILVASCVDDTDTLTSFSNGGNGSQLVAAPGNNIYSCICGGYGTMSGTSMAAPAVSAVCGIAWSVNPALNGAEVVDIVKNNVSGQAHDNSESHTTGGMNIVNAFGAAGEAYDRRTDYYGYVKDARTGQGLDAQIKFKKSDGQLVDWNVTSSEWNGGKFEFPEKIPAGYYEMEISAEGYSSRTDGVYISESRDAMKDLGTFSLTEVLSENVYQIKLHWGIAPRDLDSHLRATLQNGNTYHVYYSQKNPYPRYANLDVDDTSSWGPETITITNFEGLRNIRYAVHDYTNRRSTNSKALSNSGAYVEVIRGCANGTVEYRRFDVPRNIGGTEWDVFALDARGKIIPVNTMSYCTLPGSVLGASGRAYSAENAVDESQAAESLKPYELENE